MFPIWSSYFIVKCVVLINRTLIGVLFLTKSPLSSRALLNKSGGCPLRCPHGPAWNSEGDTRHRREGGGHCVLLRHPGLALGLRAPRGASLLPSGPPQHAGPELLHAHDPAPGGTCASPCTPCAPWVTWSAR